MCFDVSQVTSYLFPLAFMSSDSDTMSSDAVMNSAKAGAHDKNKVSLSL